MKTDRIVSYIHHFILEENASLVTAIQAVLKRDYRIRLYKDFGTGRSKSALRKDLLEFLHEQQLTQSPSLTFFGIFTDQAHDAFDWENWQNAKLPELNAHEFEDRMYRELSALSDSEFNPEEGRVYLGEQTLCVAGLHKGQEGSIFEFPLPSLMFNHPHQLQVYGNAAEPTSTKNLRRESKNSERSRHRPEIEL